MNGPKRRKLKSPSGDELMKLIKTGLHAVDELGFDWVALMREELQTEGVLPKPKDKDP